MKVKVKVIETKIYQCPTCKKEYGNQEDAEECLAEGLPKPCCKVGDIVFITSGFGWYDGDKKWVSNPKVVLKGHKSHGNCFSSCCNYQFYYVITHIDNREHELRYHVMTNAMTGRSGYRSGFTFECGHHTPEIVKNPPKYVVQDSKKLLGKKAKYLI